MFDWVDGDWCPPDAKHRGLSRWKVLKGFIAFGWKFSRKWMILGAVGILGWLLFVLQAVLLVVKG